MFEEKQKSLAELDGYDAYGAFRFLKGESWEDQFEVFEESPPEWLLKWSEDWSAEEIFTIDDIDPLIGEYLLVFDESTQEVWAGIHQGDDVAVFQKIPTDCANPDREVVCDFFLKKLEEIGDYIVYGNLTVESPEWIPREKMEPFMVESLKTLGHTKLYEMTLEEWLEREYGPGGAKKHDVH